MSEKKTTFRENDEQSIKQIILNVKELINYLLRKWKLVLLFLGIGAALGAFKSLTSTPTYTGKCTFVLDPGEKGASGGGLALLALGNGKAGLFDDLENIKWLYSSAFMIKRSLLTSVKDQNGKDRLLINWFIEENKMRKELDKSDKLKSVQFKSPINEDGLDRYQGMIINMCVGRIKEKYLQVNNAGTKTAQLLTVLFKSKDEYLSKSFTEVIVKSVNDYYINTKTEKIRKEVNALQLKADSAFAQLNSSMYKTAASYESIPNANPYHQSLQVKPQRNQVDVQMTSVMLTEIIKNLETRKLALAQETPLIQVIEKPSIPLESLTVPLIRTMIIYGLALAILSAFILSLLYFYYKAMKA